MLNAWSTTAHTHTDNALPRVCSLRIIASSYEVSLLTNLYSELMLLFLTGTLEPEGGLERVWDVILSGSFTVLPYVAVHIVSYFERKLLQLQSIGTVQDVGHYLWLSFIFLGN